MTVRQRKASFGYSLCNPPGTSNNTFRRERTGHTLFLALSSPFRVSFYILLLVICWCLVLSQRIETKRDKSPAPLPEVGGILKAQRCMAALHSQRDSSHPVPFDAARRSHFGAKTWHSIRQLDVSQHVIGYPGERNSDTTYPKTPMSLLPALINSLGFRNS